jgi:hypothetical protein
MKRSHLLALVLLFWAGVEASAQAILQQFAAVSAGAGTVSDMDLPQPTAKGSVLIAMPLLLTPDIKVVSITDNAPAGGNTYKQVKGSTSSCAKQSLDIWYCENCNPDVTELKFHLSGHVRASINNFLEVSGLALSSVLDGLGASVSDGTLTKDGSGAGPTLTTTAPDFVIAPFFSTPPLPTGVTPAAWTRRPSYVYVLQAPPGTYQPTLTGGKAGSNFCMSSAAFKAAPSSPASPPPTSPQPQPASPPSQ